MERWRDDAAYLVGLVLGLAVLVAFGFPSVRAARIPYNDFSYIWAGARAVIDGNDPYRTADWLATVARYGTEPVPEGFYVYPPHIALALLPLGALPLAVASELWTLGGMALAALGLGRLLRAAAPHQPVVATMSGFALFASQPGIATYWSGQWTFLLLAGLAFATVAALEGGRAKTAATLLLLGKPHLFPFAAIGVARAHIARGRARTVVALAIVATAIVVVPMLAFPDWLGAWLGDLGRTRVAGERAPTTLVTALRDLIGGIGVPLAIIVLIAALGFAITIDPADPRSIAVWSALSLAAPVYSWSYDHLVLLVPLVVTCGALSRIAPSRATIVSAIALAAFIIVPTLLYIVATARSDESFSAFVPVATLAFTAAVALMGERTVRGARAAAG